MRRRSWWPFRGWGDAMAAILNTIGLTLGVIGTVLIYFYGVPRQVDTGGAIHLIAEQEDEQEKLQIERFKCRGNGGLVCIGLAFFLQLVAVWM